MAKRKYESVFHKSTDPRLNPARNAAAGDRVPDRHGRGAGGDSCGGAGNGANRAASALISMRLPYRIRPSDNFLPGFSHSAVGVTLRM
jgi:hypothetical protein